jgi:hypothetical protein
MRFVWMLLLLMIGTAAWSQSPRERQVSYDDISNRKDHTTLRIDAGKVWIDGKTIPTDKLPASLQDIDPSIYYESTVGGVTEYTFNLGDHFYLVQNGALTEIDAEAVEPVGYDSKTATEAYYSQLKRESPGLFYGLSREGVLLEQVRTLLIDYSRARSKDKPTIKEEIRLVLGQLYDINERNKELEIAELEDMIEAAKKEVQYRKEHKGEIIDQSLDNLLK